MKPPLSRREFLKFAGLISAGVTLPGYLLKPIRDEAIPDKPNVLIIVFDAWSASNISLYGYGRKTTPLLESLAECAIIYHNHYSGGNFTTPGTASLLTGTLPWSHRAFILNDPVHKSYAKNNIFHAFKNYHRIGYTHNPIANTLLRQFMTGIDAYIPMHHLYLESDTLVDTLLADDHDTATVSWNRVFKQANDGFSYSLYLSRVYEYIKQLKSKELKAFAPDFPRGLPNYDGIAYFRLEDGIDGIINTIKETPAPYLGYFHFLPPHNPFKTRFNFFDKFAGDGFTPPAKPDHLFIGDTDHDEILKKRRLYDEFILYVDAEFARLYDQMEKTGLLDNTYLVLTSDHGEMFERGILGHMTPSLHQPVIKIPLVIFPPGGTKRVDVYETTSSIDLLPTLMQETSQDIPWWVEGVALPPFSSPKPDTNRDVYALQVGSINEKGNITTATVMLVQGQYKLIWYFGYDELGEDGERVELYDIEADPEELRNLYPTHQDAGDRLLEIAKAKLKEKLQQF